jgi:hypothetical protein
MLRIYKEVTYLFLVLNLLLRSMTFPKEHKVHTVANGQGYYERHRTELERIQLYRQIRRFAQRP